MKPDRDKFLTPDEFRRLLGAALLEGRPAHRKRNHLLLCLAGNLGLRVGETCALRIGDVHLEGRPPFLRVLTLKRRREVLDDLPLDEPLAELVERYTGRRRGKEQRPGIPDGVALFPTTKGKPLSSRSAQDIFKRAARRAGLAPGYSFHSLRHFRGLRLWQESGGDPKLVQKLMRHGSLSSSFVYAHLDPAKLAEVNARVRSIT